MLAAALSACVSTAQMPVQPAALPKAQTCADNAGWDDPTTARHIYGNTWYVGTCGITALLVTSPQGHVLVDAGTQASAPSVIKNIQTLGVDPRDVKVIVISHEHMDHAGGVAELQHATGARVLARGVAAEVLKSGKKDRRDPQFKEELEPVPAVENVEEITDNELIVVGDIKLQAHPTPAHTPGSTSWTWKSCESNRCLNMAYVDSLTAISDDDYRYSVPEIETRFRTTLATVADLQCDILITPHPGASNLWPRLERRSSEDRLIDAQACANYAQTATKKFEERLAKERGSAVAR